MPRLISFFLVSAILASCYSYKIFPAEYRDFAYNGSKQTAFIVNPELKKEYEMLQLSGIFIFTNDSLDKNCTKIKLQPLKRKLACGQPIIASAFTLGQLPVYFTDRYQYQFDEIHDGDTTKKRFELLIAQRTWFWDMFVIHKKFRQKAGQALLANYYAGNSSSPLTNR